MKDEYTIDIKRKAAELAQERDISHQLGRRVDEANAKIKDLTQVVEQYRFDLGRRDEKIKNLQADVEACHRTIAAGTRELEDAQSTVVRLTGEVEKLTQELGLLRNLLETAQNRTRESQEAMQRKVTEAWELDQRLDTMREVFRDTVHVLIEKL